MFWAQFVNSLIITVLVYAKVVRLERVPILFKGPYTDFISSWRDMIQTHACM